MKIVVAVKQVPEIADVQVDPETGSIRREGVPSILNPFCEYALDHAVRLKAIFPQIRITAISMGPPQARSALLRALELGADHAILACDRKFAGSDTWATALTLAQTIRKTVPDFNLIFVGKQAIDGDTAQVGPEIAEILSLPQISYGVCAELSPNLKRIQVTKEIECGSQVIEARLPVLVSFSKGEIVRRVPSFAEILAARSKPLETVTADDLEVSEKDVGLSGSFTRVVKVFAPAARPAGRLLADPDPACASREILRFLEENGHMACH
jgi:electron transfer flavoprotein beta subunit